jgi:hypothetical protein
MRDYSLSARCFRAFTKIPTVTGNFLVAPLVAFLHFMPNLHVNQSEVEQAEFVTIADLLKTLQFEMRPAPFSNMNMIEHPVFFWGKHRVWGVTAWLIYLFFKDQQIFHAK